MPVARLEIGPAGPAAVGMTTDRDATLEAIRVRGWLVVLLRRRAKKPASVVPPGAPPGTRPTWDITADVDRVARHLRGGGNVGLITGPENQVAVLDPDQLVPWADMIEAIGQPAAAWTLTGRGGAPLLHPVGARPPGQA